MDNPNDEVVRAVVEGCSLGRSIHEAARNAVRDYPEATISTNAAEEKARVIIAGNTAYAVLAHN